tara:strand:+ start:3261 stop:3659 length:399 start_codon:yes stop_codon:yes gene_type:complete
MNQSEMSIWLNKTGYVFNKKIIRKYEINYRVEQLKELVILMSEDGESFNYRMFIMNEPKMLKYKLLHYKNEMKNKQKCIFCNKSLRKYKKWKDWESRYNHYKCYKEDDRWGYLKRYRFWIDLPENKNNIEKV